MLSIHPATPSHRLSIRQCFLRVFDSSEVSNFDRIEELSYSYVGIDRHNDVRAFIIVTPSHQYAEFEIAYLGVDRRYRGKGYAKLLIKLILRNLEKNSIWLNTLEENKEARSLYENVGFIEIDKFKDVNNVNSIIYKYR